MDQNTAEVLKQLADKLGTTSEYLWSVMVRQAPIEAWVSIGQYAALIVGWLVWKNWPLRKWRECEGGSYEQESWLPALIVPAGMLAIMTCIAFFCVSDTVSAFANPEYWALNAILNKIGH